MPARVLAWAVLGLALAPRVGAAQGSPEDSARAAAADTGAVSDTAKRRIPKADSILLSFHPDTTKVKAPLAHAEQPPLLSVGASYHWNRDELFASGALTLSDLLDRIPGFTGFRGGWLSAPMIGTYAGNAGRVRVFFDGVELDPLNARTRRVHDLATIQIWTLEEVGVEQGADELRVYLRSWRVDHTTPYSRADVSTGTEETNWYRAFYGQRYGRGAGLQLGAQQYTNVGRFGGGGDETSLLGRAGWAVGPWSFDAYADRYRRGQDPLSRIDLTGNLFPAPGLPDFEGTWTDAYVRGAYGDPDHRGVWAQVIASTQDFRNSSKTTPTTGAGGGVKSTPNDTANSEAQYVAAGGFSRWGIRFSGTERVRVIAGHGVTSTPSGRAAFESGPLAVSLFAEQDAPSVWPTLDPLNRLRTIPVSTQSLAARLTPLPFFSVAGSVSRTSSTGAPDAPPTSLAMRGEAGVRLGRLWFSGGVLTSDTARLAALSVYDSTYAPAAVGRTTGVFGSIRGVLWHAINADVTGINWGSAGPYRPHYQARAELFLKSEWLSRFPRHTFSILASGSVEYRSPALFPTTAGTFQSSTDAAVISTLLEIRILHATLTWQFRNTTGYLYNLVPGYLMPRQTNLYGVRWSFWN